MEGGDDIGIRGLADASGQPKGSVERWARQELWVEQRRQYKDTLTTTVQQKTIEKTSEKLSDQLSEIAIANYKCHELARNYAAKVIETKARQLQEIQQLPLAERAAILAKDHVGYEMNYWSQILKRSTDAIESVSGLKYYVDINAAAGKLEKEGYEIIDPTNEPESD